MSRKREATSDGKKGMNYIEIAYVLSRICVEVIFCCNQMEYTKYEVPGKTWLRQFSSIRPGPTTWGPWAIARNFIYQEGGCPGGDSGPASDTTEKSKSIPPEDAYRTSQLTDWGHEEVVGPVLHRIPRRSNTSPCWPATRWTDSSFSWQDVPDGLHRRLESSISLR